MSHHPKDKGRRKFLGQAAAGAGLVAGSPLIGTFGGLANAAQKKMFEQVNLGIVAPFLSLDPAKSTGGEFAVSKHMFEPLIERNTWDKSLTPALAEGDMERLDDYTWQAKIREGAMWSDGTPVTAEDVKFSFDRINDPDYGSPFKDYIALIESVEAPDSRTVIMRSKYRTDLIPARAPMVRAVPKHVVESVGNEAFASNPGVVSGQFTNAAPFDPNKISLKRWDGYNGNNGIHVNNADWLYIAEAQTRIAQAEAGQLHIIDGLPPSMYDAVENSSELELGVSPMDQTTFVQVQMFNCGKAPFNDKRVRQAWMYAIDQQQLIDVGLRGTGKVARTPLPETHEYYAEPSIDYTGAQPDKAKALLKEAGYPNGVEFEQIVASWDYVKPMAPIIKAQLAKAGFTANLKVVPIDTYFSEIFAGNYEAFTFTIGFEVFSGDVDMLLRGWWGGFFNESAMFWTSDEAKRLPTLLDQALGEQDKAKKHDLYREAQNIIVEECATCPMLFQPFARAWRKEVLDYKVPLTLGTNLFSIHKA